MDFRLSSRMLFCDWHMPNFLPEIRINYDEHFEQVKRTGAQAMIFMAKTAHGTCLFPSEVGFTNQTMTDDLFGEIATRAKAIGLNFIAYYNMVLSWELHREHPDWQQQDAEGKPVRMFMYPIFCMSNPEFIEHVGAHIEEIARNYPIDGFFFDLQYFAPDACFCDCCRAGFAAMFGYDLAPEGFGTPQWLDFYTYQARTREAFIHSAMDRANAVREGLSWSWNGCGNPGSISSTLHEGAHYLSTEAHPPAYLHADHTTRYCEGLGLPFTLFMPESQGSWGDWTITTPETIKGLSAIALAHGGSLNINHVPYPCGDRAGTVPDVVWDTITETFDFVTEREALCRDRRPVPVVACLHSPENIRLLQAMARGTGEGHLRGEVHHAEGALTQLLMETHTPWEIRPETIAAEDLARYELIILPCLPHVTEDLAARLREYVSGGGKLLASYRTSLTGPRGEALDNFTLADLFGVDLIQQSPYSIAYLDGLDGIFRPQVPDMPLLLKDTASDRMNPKNHTLYVRPREGTRVLGRIMDPAIESDFETGHWVYHDHSPPGSLTDHPVMVLNSFGDGQVIYLPPPFFGAYGSKSCPFLKAVFRTLVQDVLGVSAKVRIQAPVSIKHSLMQDDEGWLLHLIHIQKQTDAMYLDAFTRTDPVTVRVRPGWEVGRVQDALTGESFAAEERDGWTAFTVPGVHDHTIVRIGR